MNPVFANCCCICKAFFAYGVIWCIFTLNARAQEEAPKGARYICDESGRVVYMTYSGTSGLRECAPKNVSHLAGIDIVYGVSLSAQDVSFLSSLVSVEELVLGGCMCDEYVEIEGDLAALANLKRLKYVTLSTHEMRDDDLRFVAQLPQLQYLEFPGGPDPTCKHGAVITDACAESICSAKTLRELCICGGDNLSDQFVSLISRDLKDLEHLELGSRRLTDRSLQVLAEQCRNLRWLDLYSNHFTDKGVGYLAKAKKLEMLWLESSALTHECVESVASLSQLRHLELTTPSVTDRGVKVLANLPALEILALRKPPMSDEQFAMFANHPRLESAFLNGRDLSEGNVLATIKTIPRLDYLSVTENKSLQAAINRFLAGRRSLTPQNQ